MGALPPNSPPVRHKAPALASCPKCASTLIQPAGWRELPGGALILHLRCPECLSWMVGSFEPERVAELDEELLKRREAMLVAYDRIVRANMEELAERFRQAFELDLIGPDDFVPAVRSRARAQPGGASGCARTSRR